MVELLKNPQLQIRVIGPLVVLYGIAMALSGTMRVDHVLVVSLWLAVIYVPRFRPSAVAGMPFFVFAAIYDCLRFVTPVAHGVLPPHVEGPYNLDLALFGVTGADGTAVTLPEYFLTHNHIVADLAAAVGYSGYMWIPIGYALYLLIKDHDTLWRFSWTFLLCNVVGWIIYYAYPAAPPWYVLEHGFGPAILDTPSNPARLMDVDAYLGIAYFEGLYTRSGNVFAAIPSMHPVLPLISWFFMRKTWPWTTWSLLAFVVLVSLSAVYLCHHYVIDVLIGIVLAIASGLVAEWVIRRHEQPVAGTGPEPGGQPTAIAQ